MEKSNDFVDYIFARCKSDKAFRADLRRADNPAYEWKIWPIIMKYTGSLDSDDTRRIFALVGSAIGKSNQETDGNVGIGKAFRIVSGGSQDEFPLRFMRILSSEDVADVLAVLRPTFSYFDSEGVHLDFKRILSELLRFRFDSARTRVKAGWAADYLKISKDELNE